MTGGRRSPDGNAADPVGPDGDALPPADVPPATDIDMKVHTLSGFTGASSPANRPPPIVGRPTIG